MAPRAAAGRRRRGLPSWRAPSAPRASKPSSPTCERRDIRGFAPIPLASNTLLLHPRYLCCTHPAAEWLPTGSLTPYPPYLPNPPYPQVANHPLLVRRLFTDAAVADISRAAHSAGVFGPDASLSRVKEHCAELSDFALHSLCCDPKLGTRLSQHRLPGRHALDSGKARRLAELLPQIKARGSRVLIFSQWKIMLDVLEWTMEELGVPFCRLDGSTPVRAFYRGFAPRFDGEAGGGCLSFSSSFTEHNKLTQRKNTTQTQVEERQRLVDDFNAPGSPMLAFLLSTRAGGQGINLTGADTVILHDCDFKCGIFLGFAPFFGARGSLGGLWVCCEMGKGGLLRGLAAFPLAFSSGSLACCAMLLLCSSSERDARFSQHAPPAQNNGGRANC